MPTFLLGHEQLAADPFHEGRQALITVAFGGASAHAGLLLPMDSSPPGGRLSADETGTILLRWIDGDRYGCDRIQVKRVPRVEEFRLWSSDRRVLLAGMSETVPEFVDLFDENEIDW